MKIIIMILLANDAIRCFIQFAREIPNKLSEEFIGDEEEELVFKVKRYVTLSLSAIFFILYTMGFIYLINL